MTQKLTDNGIEWEADHQETDTVPLVNKGNGKPIIMRMFEFTLPPMEKVPTNQQLLEAHKSKITAFLWKDELVPIMEFKVVKSKDQQHFRIFATCQAKAGSVILDKPMLLQDAMNPRQR
jgi:hypothetical protein